MSDPTKRELERELAALKHQLEGAPDTGPTDVTVEWRDAAPEARPTGIAYDPETATLTYDLWAAQRECLAALTGGEADLVACLAGYGSGKSILGARWLLAQALTHPGSRFLAMGVDFTKARDSTFRILFDQLPGERTAMVTRAHNGPETSPVVADYTRSANRLTLTNDATIILGAADSWSRYAGDEFGAIWLDEPSHYEPDLHDLLEMLGSRLRGVAGPHVQCWTLTGNGYNDAWEILGQRQDSTGDPIGLELEVVRASTLDNPYLDPGTRERFERQYADTDREDQALRGGFAAAQGLVYSGFSRDRHVLPHAAAVDRAGDSWRVYGYDAGWDDPRVCLELGKTSYEQLVVLDAFYESESHLEDVRAWLDDNDKPAGTIYCDHEPAQIDKLNRAGYPAEAATKDLDEGIAEVRKRLEADGNLDVGTKEKVILTIGGMPNCTHISSSTGETRRAGEPSRDEPAAAEKPAVGLLISERCQPLIR
ncbi:terminase large subunit domain-containing protein [Natrinema sp. H-ect4]|uniref:terminase large subunit domain-containing protein n=1 Tax=Natrinema sp. H-ect4 TaxID=3242699 RepID=UPI0035A8356E